MSLLDRLTEARSSTTFTPMKNADAFTHTDNSPLGRRNLTPKGVFVFPDYKRYPVSAFSRASAAGSLRQAYARGVGKKVAQKVMKNKALNMCPSILPGCPPPRDHGPGGPVEWPRKCKGKHCKVKGDRPVYWPFSVTRKRKWTGSQWEKVARKKMGRKKKKR